MAWATPPSWTGYGRFLSQPFQEVQRQFGFEGHMFLYAGKFRFGGFWLLDAPAFRRDIIM